MKIAKVLNNNIAIAVNDKNEDVIVMGCGVAFKKNWGDDIDESKIERIFTKSVPELSGKFEALIQEIPQDYLDAADKIIANAKLRLGKEFGDNLYLSLTDHVYFTVQRYEQGLTIQNRLLLETKMLYADEFRVGLDAVAYLNETFGISLPEDEAAFLALHFVNATLGTQMTETMEITKIVQEIHSIIRNYFRIEFDENSLNYFRLMTHLKFFAHRMVTHTCLNDDLEDIQLFNMVKERYAGSYGCVERITAFLKKQYDYETLLTEQTYLTIHIERTNRSDGGTKEDV